MTLIVHQLTAQQERLRELRDAGLTTGQIAKKVGRHKRVVENQLDAIGYKSPHKCATPIIDVLAGLGCGRCVACQAAARRREQRRSK